jgi:methoxymalonate biosynthesis acyl carrier protein
MDTQVTVTDIKVQIKAFLMKSVPKHEFPDDEDIFASGHVNSLYAMQLVAFVEDEFDIKVGQKDLDIEHFRSIRAIADFVARKQLS